MALSSITKTKYENDRAEAFWDVPVYGENTELKADRIDARVVNHKEKIIIVEMSCPWVLDNRQRKDCSVVSLCFVGHEKPLWGAVN